jgi:hypothetical protein
VFVSCHTTGTKIVYFFLAYLVRFKEEVPLDALNINMKICMMTKIEHRKLVISISRLSYYDPYRNGYIYHIYSMHI